MLLLLLLLLPAPAAPPAASAESPEKRRDARRRAGAWMLAAGLFETGAYQGWRSHCNSFGQSGAREGERRNETKRRGEETTG